MQTDSDAYYGLNQFTLVFEFVDYPTSTASADTAPLDIQVDPCEVTEYSAPGDLAASYLIGTTESTIYFTYSQYPCTYGASYTAELVKNGTDVDNMEDSNDDLPDFVVLASSVGQMQIYSNDRDDYGFYLIRVTAVLDNLALLENVDGLFTVTIDPENPPSSLIYTASFDITLEMQDPQDAYIKRNNTDPFFLPEPDKLYAYIGEGFVHSFGDAMDYESEDGQSVTVTIDLGEARSFAEFDFETNTISIAEGATDEFTVETSQIVLTLADDYEDEFLGDDPGVTVYTIKLHLIERG